VLWEKPPALPPKDGNTPQVTVQFAEGFGEYAFELSNR
jgi:hypothetical protein